MLRFSKSLPGFMPGYDLIDGVRRKSGVQPSLSMLGRLAGSPHDLTPLVEQAIHDALRAWQVTEEPQGHPAETATVRE